MKLKLNNILKKGLFQRIVYILALIMWTLVLLKSLINFPLSESSIKISYLTLFLIPATILSIQIILNNQIFWGLIFGLFSAFILTSLSMGMIDWIQRTGNHVKAIDWTFQDILIIIFYFSILTGIDWLIFKIRPKRLI